MRRKTLLIITFLALTGTLLFGGTGTDRFLDIYNELHDPANGYFSPTGLPYYAVETAIVEDVDYGHETTSNEMAYWIYLEAEYGRLTGQWAPLKTAWDTLENLMIPQDQPGISNYNPASPSVYMPEWWSPTDYPARLDTTMPMGTDPISEDLRQAYGDNVFAIHYLADSDGWFNGGMKAPALINSWDRGPAETPWNRLPHPADSRDYGGPSRDYLMFYMIPPTYYPVVWKYKSNPEAGAAVVQAMYRAYEAYKAQGSPDVGFDFDALISKTAKLGDFLRLSFFDTNFKAIDANTQETSTGGLIYSDGTYDNAHYLLGDQFTWSGSNIDDWAMRKGSSHVHSKSQNPMAAWILGGESAGGAAFTGTARGAAADWKTSLKRQLDFLEWQQSEEGLFTGGVTNNWTGRYLPYPQGTSEFNGMLYYPGNLTNSNDTWLGSQLPAVQRLAEYNEAAGDIRARGILDKWTAFVMNNVTINEQGFSVPAMINISGQPLIDLRASIDSYSQSPGVAAGIARILSIYARTSGSEEAATMAAALMDAVWTFKDDKGITVPETRYDYIRFNMPSGISAPVDGEQIEFTFLDLRPGYMYDSFFTAEILPHLTAGTPPVLSYHRFKDQCEAALAALAVDDITKDILVGDVDGNGVVDVVDSMLIAQYSAGIVIPGFNEAAADFNNDGIINILDAMAIAQYAAGL